jgi:ribosylpyrimidine nucleosidase
VAYLINPEIFQSIFTRVDIDRGVYSYGRTNVDIYGFTKKKKNVTVVLKMDFDKFWEIMLDSLKKANENSILNKINEEIEIDKNLIEN